jgi:2'-5' RNA ligase
VWYKFSKKKYDTAIVALCFKPKDIKGLKIKHKLTKKDLTKSDEFHVTLMYLGDIEDIKTKKFSIEKALKKLATQYSVFNLTVGGVAKFFVDGDKNPYVFTVNSPEIEPLRQDILSYMENIGISEPSDTKPFIPHMTLGFCDSDDDIDSVSVGKDQLEVDSVCLSWGGDIQYFKFKE